MTATTVAPPTQDELVTTALDHLKWADKGLGRPLTVAQLHVIRGHIKAAQPLLEALLAPPLRPHQQEEGP